jgi:hypothetical protein
LSPVTWDGEAAMLRPLFDGLGLNVTDPRFAGGAKGDGIADDTTAIQSAIDISSAPGIVLLPPGTFKHTGLTGKSGVNLIGAGAGVTILANASSNDSLRFVYGSGPNDLQAQVRNLTITKSGASTPGKGINFTRCASVRVENVRILNHVYGTYHYFGEQHRFRDVHMTNCTYGSYFDGGSTSEASNFNRYEKCFYQSNSYDVYFNGFAYKNVWESTPFYGASTASIFVPAAALAVWSDEFNACWWEAIGGLVNDLRGGRGFIYTRPVHATSGKAFITSANFSHKALRVVDPVDLTNQAGVAVAQDYELQDLSPASDTVLAQVIGTGRSFARENSHIPNLSSRGIGGLSFVTPSLSAGQGEKNLCASTDFTSGTWATIAGGAATGGQADPVGGTGAASLPVGCTKRQTITNANGGSALSGATFTTQMWAKSSGGRLQIYMLDSNAIAIYQKAIDLPTNQWVLCSLTIPFTAGTGTSLLVDVAVTNQAVILYWPVVTKGDVIVPALPVSRDMSGWAKPYQVVGQNHNILTYDSAAPVAGTWAVGDIVYHTAPAASGNIGWVCTTGGTPGTWKTFGAIAA